MDQTSGSNKISESLAAYRGRWVAEIQGRIVGQGGTPDQALQAAKAARRKENPEVRFIPAISTLQLPEILNKINEIIPDNLDLYLVGGAVRDALLQKPSYDLDFCMAGDALKFARKVANKFKGAFYRLDQEHGAGRVVINDPEAGRVIMDFAPFRGDSLEDDLLGRDFTMNAIAVNIKKPQELHDPLGGAADLATGWIRACSPQALKDDPVRIIRAIRLAAQFKFRIEAETLKLIKNAVPGLVQISVERQRDEFFKILRAPNPAASIRILERLGAIAYILPEVEPMIGFAQAPPHIYDVWEHSLQTLATLEKLTDVLDEVYQEDSASQMNLGLVALHLGRYRDKISQVLQQAFVQERSKRLLLMLAALYHDSGKPVTFKQTDDYAGMFIDHDLAGAEIAGQMAVRMHFSRKEAKFISDLVRNHLAVTRLTKSEGNLSRKQMYHFFRAVGENAVPVILLNIADIMGAYGSTLTQAKLIRYLEISRQILDALWENPENEYTPDLFLNGQDLMELFDLDPSPQVGQLLEALREAQVVDGIENRTQAITYLRGIVEE